MKCTERERKNRLSRDVKIYDRKELQEKEKFEYNNCVLYYVEYINSILGVCIELYASYQVP
jgi:hypothetical protein